MEIASEFRVVQQSPGVPPRLMLTPPRRGGRLGHSLPTPKALGEGPIFYHEDAGSTEEVLNTESPVKNLRHLKLDLSMDRSREAVPWYQNRHDHYKPPVSPLDKIRPPLLDVKLLETFKEEWDAEENQERCGEGGVAGYNDIISLTNRLVINSPDSTRDELERFKGDSLLSVSYKLFQPLSPLINVTSGGGDELGGSFVSAFSNPFNSSFNVPFVTSPTKEKDSCLFPTVVRNPNKALLTIDAKSSLILVTNEVACNMFGYQKCDLIGLKIQHLFTEPYQSRQRALVEENINASGETVLISGKVMDAVTSYGLVFPVSVWMKKVTPTTAPDPRVVIVIEPVERCSLNFTLEKDVIVCCDGGFAALFGYSHEEDVIGAPISSLIPSIVNINLSSTTDQGLSLTGRGRDGSAFPLEIVFIGSSVEPLADANVSLTHQNTYSPEPSKAVEEISSCDKSCDAGEEVMATSTSDGQSTGGTRVLTHGKIVVYASLSGMVCFNNEGSIEGCNQHFALMLFGYSQKELMKKDITFIMPNFYSHLADIQEVDEEEESIPIHPLFEQEVQLGRETSQDLVSSELKMNSTSSIKDDLFHSVSERSVSLEYGLDSHLASISEEGSDVFLSDPPTHESLSTSSCFKGISSNSVIDKEYGLNEDAMEDQEVLRIQFLPHSVNIGDCLYEYSDSISNEEEESGSHDDEIEHMPDHGNEEEPGNYDDVMEHNDNKEVSKGVALLTADNVSKEDRPQLSSTPCRPSSRPSSRLSSVPSRAPGYPEGTYLGTVKHKDGSLITVIFELKQISLKNDRSLYCMWISREQDCILNDTSSNNTPLDFTRQHNHQILQDCALSSSILTSTHDEALASDGKFLEAYETLGPIGRGAFGFVKLAKQRDDSSLVVVKFIKKSTVISENWIQNESMGLVPREICLLAQLSHPNIIQLLEAYENEHYFQLVMEKHGDGMDMFSFIESGPCLDEYLISYLFRQIVSGLSYLHQKCILHRDVKDENLILDQKFHVKLIDFGSAVLMEEGKLFNTFCGTLEYCSPEVLLGNSYAGPELEMWSLGVTLYTIVYSENPFFDVEEIISGQLQPPHLVSPGLMKIILWLLHPDPVSRATLKDLEKDKWINQPVDLTEYSFESVMEAGARFKEPSNRSCNEGKMKRLVNRTLS